MSLGEAEAEEMTDVSTTCAGTVSAINLKDGGESSIDDRSLAWCTAPCWWWWCVCVDTTTAAALVWPEMWKKCNMIPINPKQGFV